MASQWLQKGLFSLVDVTASLLDLLLIPFFVYYLLADYSAMRTHLDRLIPPRHRAVASTLISRINFVISSYVRNQLVIALVMGVLYAIGFAVARVPLALSIGLLSGLLNFIPYLGTLTGLTLSLSFVALDGGGIARILGVLAVFIIVQSLEGYYLTPKLLGGSLDLHPMWVLVGLMIGGSLFGILGIILAVPVIAIAKVALDFLEELYQQSDFYRDSGLELLAEQSLSDRPRRTIITTSELRSRIEDRGSKIED
jgi:predicted PurR-regulated permease PerM